MKPVQLVKDATSTTTAPTYSDTGTTFAGTKITRGRGNDEFVVWVSSSATAAPNCTVDIYLYDENTDRWYFSESITVSAKNTAQRLEMLGFGTRVAAVVSAYTAGTIQVWLAGREG